MIPTIKTSFIVGTIGSLLRGGSCCSKTAVPSTSHKSLAGMILVNRTTLARSRVLSLIRRHGPMDSTIKVHSVCFLPLPSSLKKFQLLILPCTFFIGWLDLVQYYITAFKYGVYPDIARDRVFLWARLYPANADAPDYIGKPQHWEFVRIAFL